MTSMVKRLLQDASAIAYGLPRWKRRHGAAFGALENVNGFWLVGLAPFVCGLAICVIVLAVDPFQLRPWGPGPRLSDSNYPELVTAKLVHAAVSEPQDVVVLGGSTAMGITPSQLREVFAVRRAINLSYNVPYAADTTLAMQEAIEAPGLQRLIVELPFTLLDSDHPVAATGAAALSVLDSRWYSLPDFEIVFARASLERLRTGVFSLPRWRQQARNFFSAPSLLDKPETLDDLTDAFRTVPSRLFQPGSPIPCARFRFISDAIIPVARRAAEKRVTLDLYFVPLPLLNYPTIETREDLKTRDRNVSLFNQIVRFHECVASELARGGLNNVHIHAIDTDAQLVAQIWKYKDTYHLLKPDAYRRIIVDIRDRNMEISAKSTEQYSRNLRNMILQIYKSVNERKSMPL